MIKKLIFFVLFVVLLGLSLNFFALKEKNVVVAEVEMYSSVAQQLNLNYELVRDEFVFCLVGDVVGTTLIIENIYVPEIVSSDEDSVLSKPCETMRNPKTFFSVVGTVHKHKTGRCMLSYPQDIYTFGKTDYLVSAIICGVDNVVFYTDDNLLDGIVPNII